MLSTSSKFILSFFILGLIFISTLKSFGQKGYFPGYIVSNLNDTIQVKIKIINQEKNGCVYIDLNGKNCTVDPVTVNAFAVKDGRQYRYLKYDNQSNGVDAYFEVLESGDICLFSYKERFFIQKNNGEIIELRNTIEDISRENGTNFIRNKREYVGILKFLLSDSKSPIPDLTDIDLAKKDLLKVVRIYNEGETYLEELNRLKYKRNFTFGIEALVASDNYKFRFPSKSFIDEYKGTFLSSGIGLTAKCQFTKHVSVNSGVRVKYLDYSIFKMYGVELSKRYYTLKNDFLTLSLPVIMDCQFDQMTYRPYVGLGVQIEKNFQKNHNCIEESTSYSVTDFYTHEYRTNFLNPINSYWIVEFGVNPVIRKLSFIVKAQYLMSLPVVNSNEECQFYHQSGLQLILGITF